MNEEPTYNYVRGQGWVVSYNQNVFFMGVPCEILDRRTRGGDGVYKYELWLVNVKQPDSQRPYSYTNWVENWLGRTWDTVEQLMSYVIEHTSNYTSPIYNDPEFKHRIVRVDW